MSFAQFRAAFGEEEFYSSKQPFSYMTTTDLVETDKEFKVFTDIPGVDPSNLKIWLQDYTLGIKATRPNTFESSPDLNVKFHQHALPHGDFEKHVHMPRNCALDQATSEYKNGVLQVSFPKIEGIAEPEHKKITVNMA